MDHEQSVYTIGKCRCVFSLKNKKVFVNGQVTMSQKSMVCRDVLNYGRGLSGEPVSGRYRQSLRYACRSILPHDLHQRRGAKRLFKKIVNETLRAQQNVIDAVEDRMTRIGLLDCNLDTLDMDDDEYDDQDDYGYSSDDSSGNRRVVCGNLNEGRRIDYMLQEKEIEHANEYVAALAAHSSYWIEKDLSLFVAQQILHSTVEASIADSQVVSPETFM